MLPLFSLLLVKLRSQCFYRIEYSSMKYQYVLSKTNYNTLRTLLLELNMYIAEMLVKM